MLTKRGCLIKKGGERRVGGVQQEHQAKTFKALCLVTGDTSLGGTLETKDIPSLASPRKGCLLSTVSPHCQAAPSI